MTEVLGATLWDAPRAILRALAQPRARVAVRGCHRSSKTWTLGQAVVWWVTTGGRVVTTAPSGDAVEPLWREIREAYAKARTPLGGEMLIHEWKLGQETLAIGRSTDKSERFQGLNHPRLLVILDEAPAIRPEIFGAVEGLRSGGDVRVCLLGNPTSLGGAFHAAFHEQRAAWQTFAISALDTPNLQGLTLQDVERMTPAELDARIVIPGMVTGAWVQERLREWPEGDPWRSARVLGEFPTQSDSALYPLTWLERAGPPGNQAAAGLLVAGIDPAGDGSDETALVVRRGDDVIEITGSRAGAEAWGMVRARLQALGGPAAFEAVPVDVDGIGWGLARELEAAGYPVVDCHAGSAPRDPSRFVRAKDERHWALRERLEAGQLHGLTDETTIAQLAQIQWRMNLAGRVEVESKAQMSARGCRSPDRAEALMLACIASPPVLGAVGVAPHLQRSGGLRDRGRGLAR